MSLKELIGHWLKGSQEMANDWLVAVPPSASRHFIEASRIPLGGRGGIAVSLLVLRRLLQRQVSRRPQGRDSWAHGPVGFLGVSGLDTGERWRWRPAKGAGSLGFPASVGSGGAELVDARRALRRSGPLSRANTTLTGPKFSTHEPSCSRAYQATAVAHALEVLLSLSLMVPRPPGTFGKGL